MKKTKQMLSFCTLYMKTGRIFFIVLFTIATCQLGFTYHNLSSFSFTENTCAPSYQELIDRSYFLAFYLAMHIVVALGIVLTALKLPKKGPKNYILQRLNISDRERYFYSILLCFLGYFSVILLQNAVILLSFVLYSCKVPINNGLTYAYLNQPFMRAIAPIRHPLRIAHFVLTLEVLSFLSLRLAIFVNKQQFLNALGYTYILFCTSLQSVYGTFPLRPVLLFCTIGLAILYPEIRNLKRNEYF